MKILELMVKKYVLNMHQLLNVTSYCTRILLLDPVFSRCCTVWPRLFVNSRV